MLQLELEEDPGAFAAALGGWLSERESQNALFLGLLERLARDPGARPTMLRVARSGEPVFAVLDGGENLIITAGPDDAVDAAAARLSDLPLEPPGVVGPAREAERFASAWARARSCDQVLVVDQRIYELTELRPLPSVPGGIRALLPDDLGVAAAWALAFDQEALPFHERRTLDEEARRAIARRIGEGNLFGWEVNGQLVSMAGLSRPTARTISVNSVYTPPAHRRHGYATALVAAISREGFARGKEVCVLYTDLANPTANAIYQTIGYRPVADSRLYAFRKAHP
jgi:predicted GNAT family acetyltransferase